MSRRAPVLPVFSAMILFALLLNIAACGDANTEQKAATETTTPAISGRIEAGLRVLTIDPAITSADKITVYRGDYLRLESTDGKPITFAIAELKINKTYPVAEGEKAYFKMPTTGIFSYTVGDISGEIEAIEYMATGYQEVSAKEGAALIKNIDPIILDVRSPGEFASGHIIDAKLIPVQVLQAELGQLAEYKDKPIFVYCRSGNRSTVAAKMMIDNGFTNITNLRHGIKEWQGKNLPVTK